MSTLALENSHNDSQHTMFELLRSATADVGVARLGRLTIANRRPIETPNFLAVASRGVIPHLTPDNLARHTNFDAAYMALEDFLEKKNPPILNMPPGQSRGLQRFTSFPSDRALILGPRRFPAVTTPVGNGEKHLSIFTSTGFRQLTVREFASTVEALQPDIVIPPADLFHTSTTPPSKRQIRMVERTEDWVDEFFERLDPRTRLKQIGVSVFAPVLPVEYPIQWDYLRHLSEDIVDNLSGLSIYDVNLLPELANYPPLLPLPRLSFGPSKTPHDILRQISLGVDVCTIPFMNSVSDAGVALAFTFPPPETSEVLPLGIDMWSEDHIAAVSPLAEGCQCYACRNHHRAFVKHLLNAKEMLGWNLLQIHNHWMITNFFTSVRETLSEGISKFEEASRKFAAAYEPAFPQGTGERPRARGYHFKSIAGQAKINEPSWQALAVEEDGQAGAENSASDVTPPANDAIETPIVPEVDGATLVEKGFAEQQEK